MVVELRRELYGLKIETFMLISQSTKRYEEQIKSRRKIGEDLNVCAGRRNYQKQY